MHELNADFIRLLYMAGCVAVSERTASFYNLVLNLLPGGMLACGMWYVVSFSPPVFLVQHFG
jgi:hypothetical protein